MMRLSPVMLFLAVFTATFGFSRPAFAYLDPGSGSMLLQLLLGGVAGAVVVLKLYWQRISNLCRRKEPEQSHPPTSEQDQ